MKVTRKFYRIFGVLSFALLLLSFTTASVHADVDAIAPRADQPVVIYFFWGDGCPHCADEKPFLEALQRQHPSVEVRSYEVWYDQDNREIFQQMSKAVGFELRGVPVTVIGERSWIGFSGQIGEEIESKVAACLETGCPDAGVGVIPGVEPPESDIAEDSPEASGEGNEGDEGDDEKSEALTLPLIGRVNLQDKSLIVSTALIGFVDGFNPCSLWVLSILIALTLRTGSRRKILIIGLTFITVTAFVYVLFIAGLFTMLTVIDFMGWIQAAVSVLALFFASVNIKDYFWYKEGLSFTIDDEKKPGIYKRMRQVMQAGDSWTALVMATAGLGLGVSLVEFSCTAGLPVLWTNLVAAQDVTPLAFTLLLLLYMVIYQIDELAIFLVAVFTLRASRLEEKHGRILKLISGMLMLTLAIVMLVRPALMNSVQNSLIIFGVAFGAALLVLGVHRAILPRFGVTIGTEFSEARGKKGKRRRRKG